MSLDMVVADALQHLLFFRINAPVSFGHQDQYTEHCRRCRWFSQAHQSRVNNLIVSGWVKAAIDRDGLTAWGPPTRSPGEG